MERNGFNEHFCCAGKAVHPTRAQAKAVLKRMMRRRLRNARLEVYRCRKCRLWHIGNAIRTYSIEDWRRKRRQPGPAVDDGAAGAPAREP